ncbi:MAG TPA: hypothetical protein PL081_08470, partial [Pseudomonadales bacterium]|nr:hypothetical protein [Pseudomonadales bacterium]
RLQPIPLTRRHRHAPLRIDAEMVYAAEHCQLQPVLLLKTPLLIHFRPLCPTFLHYMDAQTTGQGRKTHDTQKFSFLNQ